MASVKISALPQITEYDNNAVIATVDSGSTQTSKIQITDLFRASGQTLNGNKNLIIAAGSVSGAAVIDTTDERNVIIASEGGTITNGARNGFIAAAARAGGGQAPKINGGTHNAIISAFRDSEILNSAERSIILADEDGKIGGGYMNVILGSSQSFNGYYLGGTQTTSIISSTSGNVERSTNYTTLACSNYTAQLENGGVGAMISSRNPTHEPVGSGREMGTIINSYQSTLKQGADNQMITNSRDSRIDDQTSTGTQMGYIVNSEAVSLSGNSAGGVKNWMVSNSNNSTISKGPRYINIINSEGVDITSTGIHNMVMNCSNIDIENAEDRITLIGLHGSIAGNILPYDDTVHVGALHNYGPRSGKIFNGGSVSGVVDVDGSIGEMFEFTMTGNTQPNFINLREGQKFLFAIYNDGSHNVTGGTINGVGGNVLAKGGNLNPSANSWNYYTGWYDGTRVFLIEENGLSSI